MSEPVRRLFRAAVLSVSIGFVFDFCTFACADPSAPSHPIIVGFERFGSSPGADRVADGLLLVGEFGCVSCHRAEKGLEAHLNTKEAPVLDTVGSRVRPEYLRAFLTAPHSVKPGTTMPDLLGRLPEAEKADIIESLTHFLASTGALSHARARSKLVAAGEVLYRRVGCAVCHGPLDKPLPPDASSAFVPLGNLAAKYTIPSLASFLVDPLRVRHTGRMPDLKLTGDEPRAIAEYLLKDLRGETRPNLEYRYYEGEWEKIPNFTKLKPEAAGKTDGFDLSVAKRNDNMALEYRGTIRLGRAGRYRFKVVSDDGSKLLIDGRLVIDNDGIHAPQEKSESVELTKGDHALVASIFNGGGGAELEIQLSGPGMSEQPVEAFLVPIEDGKERRATANADSERFTPDPSRVEKGRRLFASIGCASCHSLDTGEGWIASSLKAPGLGSLRENGCLAPSGKKGVPDFGLSGPQQEALAAALKASKALAGRKPTDAETITRTMTALNCYACHSRSGRGGVEGPINTLFETTQREMGDEGRIPPLLDGVAAKLNADYLTQTLAEGLKDRPYMLTKMPKFGAVNTSALAKAFLATDHVEAVPEPSFEDTPRKVKSTGRFIVGAEALGCIKCHTFKGSEAEGIQAIDMTLMTRRLRRDWFHRYVVNPPAFRPGTRMPTGWPDGKSMLVMVLGGDTSRQVEAVWRFLSDGDAAQVPYGLGREPMPLFAIKEPVIYRNFIEGAGSRAIGVGYPEKANLAFDANDLRLAIIWQNGFIDASRHWTGRGEGFQPPMGDNVVALPAGVAFAALSGPDQPWPTQDARYLGYAFRGYRLDASRRPAFLYDLNGVKVEDGSVAIAAVGKRTPGLTRSLKLSSDTPPDGLWFRAAVGETVKPLSDGWFLVNGEWKVKLEAAAAPVVITKDGKSELRVPVRFDGKSARIVERFEW